VTDSLVSALSAVLTRVVAMEPLAVPTAAYASKRWVVFRQDEMYWCNRPGGFQRPTGPEDMPTYPLSIQMRLVLAYHTSIVREDNLDGNAQEKSWEYIAAVARYFEKYRFLDPPGLARLSFIDPIGCSLSCPVGADLKIMPLSRTLMYVLDFDLAVPLLVSTSDT
jgi:hypothetical protein